MPLPYYLLADSEGRVLATPHGLVAAIPEQALPELQARSDLFLNTMAVSVSVVGGVPTWAGRSVMMLSERYVTRDTLGLLHAEVTQALAYFPGTPPSLSVSYLTGFRWTPAKLGPPAEGHAQPTRHLTDLRRRAVTMRGHKGKDTL